MTSALACLSSWNKEIALNELLIIRRRIFHRLKGIASAKTCSSHCFKGEVMVKFARDHSALINISGKGPS